MTYSLVIIRNKKLNIHYDDLSAFIRVFSAGCYYFDKIAAVAFDSPRAITDQLKECKNCFDNCVVICRCEQKSVIADYLQKIYGSTFGQNFFLNSGDDSVLLGTPEEGQDFARKCVQFFNRKYGISYDKFYVRCVSAPAELIYGSIEKAKENGGDTAFAVYDDYGDQTIEISYSSNTPKMIADGIQRVLVSRLDDYIYALENIPLERRLYDLLKLRRMKISVAESFTGGGISSRLVSVPGISEVYFEGINAYDNMSKHKRLNVGELTLKQSGAVSERTAYEMVEGLLKTGNCNAAISTTGIAGPKSDNTSKPVGLAFIGVGTNEGIKVYKFNYKGDRESITRTAINDALFLAYKMLK